MRFPLLPDLIVTKLPDLSPDELRNRGIRLLMLDFDNTIVPYTTNIPDEEMDRWLRNMLRSEIVLCVVSNSRNNRVPDFCREHGIPCVVRAKKPGTKGIRQALAQFEIRPKEAALAGDQIFTEVLGGNSAGVMTILVKAIDNHNVWLKLRHVAELPFIYAARRKKR